MKIFILGSNSFSGASFSDYCLEQGATVFGMSRSLEPQDFFLKYKRNKNFPKNFNFKQVDLNTDLDDFLSILDVEKPDYVVNFAAQSMVAESWLNPIDWFNTNTIATIKMHDEIRRRTFIKKYVHISTPEVYGSCSGFVTEEHHLNPSTPYAVSRAAADMSLRTFYDAYNMPYVSTRAANVYGAGQQLYRVIPKLAMKIKMGEKFQLHGGGVSTRSFIHIDDVSSATWTVMENGASNNIYHISTKSVISIRALVEMICNGLGVSFDEVVEIVSDRVGKDSAYHLDSTKIRETLNWEDRISLEAGVDESIKWITDNFSEMATLPLEYVHKK